MRLPVINYNYKNNPVKNALVSDLADQSVLNVSEGILSWFDTSSTERKNAYQNNNIFLTVLITLRIYAQIFWSMEQKFPLK